MKTTAPTLRRKLRAAGFVVALAGLTGGCSQKDTGEIQGYVEGEFVYVASPLAGRLEELPVQRGAQVAQGALLFVLESVVEKAAQDEAARRLMQAQASLQDAKKGRRPTEMESLSAQLEQARTAMSLSAKELARQEQLARTGATSADDVDRARSTHEQNQHRVTQLQADLKTAQLGQRTDQITAAEAEVKAREAALARAEWELAQKRQNAPKEGLVFDTLYREGEWVAAGRPVVVLLPPENVKVRAFVPEPRIGTVHPGDTMQVIVDGVKEPLTGKVSFISPQAEFTPPVIYSRESRSKLVFMIELVFDPQVSGRLHPGQPVDVRIKP